MIFRSSPVYRKERKPYWEEQKAGPKSSLKRPHRDFYRWNELSELSQISARWLGPCILLIKQLNLSEPTVCDSNCCEGEKKESRPTRMKAPVHVALQ